MTRYFYQTKSRYEHFQATSVLFINLRENSTIHWWNYFDRLSTLVYSNILFSSDLCRVETSLYLCDANQLISFFVTQVSAEWILRVNYEILFFVRMLLSHYIKTLSHYFELWQTSGKKIGQDCCIDFWEAFTDDYVWSIQLSFFILLSIGKSFLF